jgi:hypothetical protein
MANLLFRKFAEEDARARALAEMPFVHRNHADKRMSPRR